MGRPAKSSAVKKASGTLQPCRQNRTVLTVNGELNPAPPVGLTKDARAAWEMAIACASKGVLTPLDHSVLERWCRNYALYRKLSREVEEGKIKQMSPDGTEKPSAEFTALMKVQTALSQCEKELGFTPASRTHVRVENTETEGNEFSEFV